MNLHLLYCYLSGQHEYGVQCEPGEIFLRCIHCGRRSAGWEVKTTKPATRTAASAGKQDATAGNKKRPARSTSPVAASV
jgi:hypothetical protein